MDIPKRLKIQGKYFKVIITQEGDYGGCNIDTCEITVRATQHPQQMKDTLLHEINHTISDMLALNLSERQVHTMSTAQYEMLHNNKHFAKWLMESSTYD